MTRRDGWSRAVGPRLVVAFVGLGIVLRLVQYAAGDSLWLDEASLSISIVSRTAVGLISSPLYFNQVAPPLFLVAVKGATYALGPTEFALRLPALLSSIAALILFAFLARRVLDGLAVPFAVGLFAVSPTLVRYAVEVKQYSGDLLAAVLLTLLALELRASRFSRRIVVTAAVAGVAIVWLSQGSVIVLAGLALALALLAALERDRRAFIRVSALAFAWAVAATASILVARHNMQSGGYDYLRHYWRREFMPFPPASREAVLWLYGNARSFYAPGLGFRMIGGLCVAVGAFGAWLLWRKGRRDVLLLFLTPVLVALAGSAARQYPFAARLTLFLFPAFVVALAAGVGWLAGWFHGRAPALEFATLLFFAGGPAYGVLFRHPPWWREDIKPVLAHVAENRSKDDAVYVFSSAQAAMIFYGPRYGFAPGEWTRGGDYRRDTRSYLRDIDHFRGRRRVWVIMAHTMVPRKRQAIVGYLNLIGARRDSVAGRHNGPRADAVGYLYDLSDTVRLRASSANSYPIPADLRPAAD